MTLQQHNRQVMSNMLQSIIAPTTISKAVNVIGIAVINGYDAEQGNTQIVALKSLEDS